MTALEEHVVLLDESGRATGSAPKAGVHHQRTPLHLAFSCYVFDADGALLLTRRALHKPTWPGAWTNSVCGHPGPGEPLEEAVARRAREELGIGVADLQLALPEFRYEAVMDNGVRENEMCPVFVAATDDRVRPAAEEVAAFEWAPWPALHDEVRSGRRRVSPWCAEQVRLLRERELTHGRMGGGDRSMLPPGASTCR
jgi:isopentenyl-diphosphate delta-isomerase